MHLQTKKMQEVPTKLAKISNLSKHKKSGETVQKHRQCVSSLEIENTIMKYVKIIKMGIGTITNYVGIA